VQALWIAAFGALGTLLRYGATVACIRVLGPEYPFGTLLVNFLGSFLLAALIPVADRIDLFGLDARLVLGIGLLGGFTTYSSFNLETVRMIEQGLALKALGYSALTLFGCLGSGALGLALGRMWSTTSG